MIIWNLNNQVFVITEFVLTEFHCTLKFYFPVKLLYFPLQRQRQQEAMFMFRFGKFSHSLRTKVSACNSHSSKLLYFQLNGSNMDSFINDVKLSESVKPLIKYGTTELYVDVPGKKLSAIWQYLLFAT